MEILSRGYCPGGYYSRGILFCPGDTAHGASSIIKASIWEAADSVLMWVFEA